MEKPWKKEPDYHEFLYNGIRCKMERNKESLFWMGYAGVDEKHPLYGVEDGQAEQLLECHGGVTYSGEKGRDGYWYFGFDCGHAGDLIPRLADIFTNTGNLRDIFITGVYRDFEYVKKETTELAKQLHNNKIRYLFRERT